MTTSKVAVDLQTIRYTDKEMQLGRDLIEEIPFLDPFVNRVRDQLVDVLIVFQCLELGLASQGDKATTHEEIKALGRLHTANEVLYEILAEIGSGLDLALISRRAEAIFGTSSARTRVVLGELVRTMTNNHTPEGKPEAPFITPRVIREARIVRKSGRTNMMDTKGVRDAADSLYLLGLRAFVDAFRELPASERGHLWLDLLARIVEE